MTSKNIILIVVLVMVAVGVGAYLINQQQSGSSVTSSYNSKTQGKVVFGVTDAASDMSDVTSVLITVNKVQIHGATSGWSTVSTQTRQYDLLVLKQSGAVALLANANVNVGTYDQLKLTVSKVTVVKNGVSQDAKLPSGELTIMGNIVVNTDKTSTIVFDFMADKSLHMTGNGKIIFAPVVKVKKTNNVNVEVKENDQLNIVGGDKENDEDFGMDEKGDVKDNFELKGNLNIDADDTIKLEGGVEGKVETNNALVFNFTAQNNSGVSGTAKLSGEDGKVKVTLKLMGGVATLISLSEPAHIHVGNCPNVGGVKYPLNPVVNGESETTINTSLSDLKAELPLAINVHKSAAEINTYIACTDVSF